MTGPKLVTEPPEPTLDDQLDDTEDMHEAMAEIERVARNHGVELPTFALDVPALTAVQSFAHIQGVTYSGTVRRWTRDGHTECLVEFHERSGWTVFVVLFVVDVDGLVEQAEIFAVANVVPRPPVGS